MHLSQKSWALMTISTLLVAPLRAETPLPGLSPAGDNSASAIAQEAIAQTAHGRSAKGVLERKRIGHMRPVHALGDIYLAGQPTPGDLPLLKREGIKTIITLRETGELPWDEGAAVTQHGMRFVPVPFRAPEELKPQVFDDVLKVLRSKERGPTVLHCGAANRVGAIWYAYRILDGKISPDAALKEAQLVGLRTPAYLERAQAYVKDLQSRLPTAD